jgi:hypothetical protein
METKVLGYLLEEKDYQGNVVWKIMSWTEPDLAWINDLKNQKHNLTITELIAGQSKTINGVKKYDSSKFVVGL